MLQYYFLRWSFKLSLFEIQSTVETSIWNLLRIYSSSCKNYVWRKPSILLPPGKYLLVAKATLHYNHKCLFVHPSISKTTQQLEIIILHHLCFIILYSSFIIILNSSFLHFATFKLFSLFGCNSNLINFFIKWLSHQKTFFIFIST